jgi:hypothetical protein
VQIEPHAPAVAATSGHNDPSGAPDRAATFGRAGGARIVDVRRWRGPDTSGTAGANVHRAPCRDRRSEDDATPARRASAIRDQQDNGRGLCLVDLGRRHVDRGRGAGDEPGNDGEEIREAAGFAREHGYGLWSGCITDAEGDTNELTAAQPDPEIALPPPSAAEPAPAPEPAATGGECDFGSYPDVCIPPIGVSGDLDCGQISPRRFTVLPPDPHGFDGDFDGIGCESG